MSPPLQKLHRNGHPRAVSTIGTNFPSKKFSNKNKQEGFLIDKYRYCSNSQDQHIKTICKPRFVKYIGCPHNVELFNPLKNIDVKGNIISGPFNNNHTIDILQINHYILKSHEEAIEKHNRGRADVDGRISLPKNLIELDKDNNDIIDNYCANKYLQHIILIKKENNI